jgi:hypothetical protein
MLLFIPRSLCALKRVAAKAEHARYGATQGIRITLTSRLYRAEATDGHRAMVVQGLIPIEDPPWPGFKDLPDEACETIISPKDLERASKLGEGWLQSRFGVVGMATSGNDIYLGLGNDVINTRTVEGRFPNVLQVIPKKRPLFTFRVDPKLLAETLLAMADLLPEGSQGVQCFYYGDNLPVGFCARNTENGLMIDALVVPLTRPEPEDKTEKGSKAEDAEGQPEGEPEEEEPENPGPEGPEGQESPTTEAPPEANAAPTDKPKPAKKRKKARAS